jgi:hypothetical protein
VGIAVADAPSLEHDNGNQRQHDYDDGCGESDGDNQHCIHTLVEFDLAANLAKRSKTTVPWQEKIVSF